MGVNILPLLPDPYYAPGRANDTVSAVTPARKSPEPEEQRERASRQTGAQVLDAVQREALVHSYTASQGTRREGYQPRHQQRALDAYSGVALQDKRELLVDLLGINEYA